MIIILDLDKTAILKSLNLRKEILGITLTKKSIPNIKARVAVVMDKSGSMRKLYKDCTVQSLLERLFPIALKFDDNGELDIWIFNDEYIRMKVPVSQDNFHNYIDEQIMHGPIEKFWGQTKYSPVMKDICQKYIKEEFSKLPTLIIFITDGNNSDKSDTKKILIEASSHNLFWQFVGIGDEKFEFLMRLDNLKGRVVDNANFFDVKDINALPDERLYDMLLSEYPDWEKVAREKKIL